MDDPLLFPYELSCTFPECPFGPGKRTVWNSFSCGWRMGHIVPHDPSEPRVGECPNCNRHLMRVVYAPPAPQPGPGPEGFWKIPTS
jgi:hypothetical protein